MRQLQSVLAAFAAALLLGGLLSAAPVEAAAPAEQRPAAHKRYANKAFAATNNRRDAHERRALRRNDCVQKWARRKARKMARQERMVHQDLRPVHAQLRPVHGRREHRLRLPERPRRRARLDALDRATARTS